MREPEQKLALSQAMLTDSNKRVGKTLHILVDGMQVVLEADTSAVFLADLQMVAAIPKVQQLWRDTTNAPDDYINKHMAKGLTVSISCARQQKTRSEGEFFRCNLPALQAGLPLSGDLSPAFSSQYSASSR